jgi:hypothetical protein
MKITIKAETKEIAALVRELEGRQSTVISLVTNDDAIESVVKNALGSSKVTTKAEGININGECNGAKIGRTDKDRKGEDLLHSATIDGAKVTF